MTSRRARRRQTAAARAASTQRRLTKPLVTNDASASECPAEDSVTPTHTEEPVIPEMPQDASPSYGGAALDGYVEIGEGIIEVLNPHMFVCTVCRVMVVNPRKHLKETHGLRLPESSNLNISVDWKPNDTAILPAVPFVDVQNGFMCRTCGGASVRKRHVGKTCPKTDLISVNVQRLGNGYSKYTVAVEGKPRMPKVVAKVVGENKTASFWRKEIPSATEWKSAKAAFIDALVSICEYKEELEALKKEAEKLREENEQLCQRFANPDHRHML